MKSIFVSSTFKDMNYERDLINNYLWPKINEFANKYNRNISFTDLRWGVNTENLDSNEGARKVLEVCFDEIENSQPYMIIFIGERYGWIPSKYILEETGAIYNLDDSEDKSVTELEIEFGALNQKDMSNCIFCFRNKIETDNLPEDITRNYVAEDERHKKKLDALKQKILAKNPENIIYYDAKLNSKGELEISNNLVQELEKILTQKMEKEWGKLEEEPWQKQEMRKTNFYINNERRKFEAREQLVLKYCMMIAERKYKMYVIEGDTGSGKTAIAAELASSFRGKNNDNGFAVFIGTTKKNSTMKEIFTQINYFLAEKIGILDQYNSNEDVYELHQKLIEQHYNKFKKDFVIILDGFENCKFSNANDGFFGWYRRLENETIILTQKTGFSSPEKIYKRENEVCKIQIPELTNEEKEKLINKFASLHNKQLSNKVIDKICELKSSNNPLYLETMTQRLINMNKEDFARVRQYGDGMEAINKVQIEIIENLPDDLPLLAKKYFEYAGQVIGLKNVNIILNLVSITSELLSRKDIEQILKENNYEWNDLMFSSLRRYLSMYLEENDEGTITLKHARLFLKGMEDNAFYQDNYKMVYNYLDRLDKDNILKKLLYVEFAYMTGNTDKIYGYIKILYNEEDKINAYLVMNEIGILLDVKSTDYDIMKKFADEFTKTCNLKNDIKFLNNFLIESMGKILYDNNISKSEVFLKFFLDDILELVYKNSEDIDYYDKMYLLEQLFFLDAKINYLIKNYPKACQSFENTLKVLENSNLEKKEKLQKMIEITDIYQDVLVFNNDYKKATEISKINLDAALELERIESNEINLNRLAIAYRKYAYRSGDMEFFKSSNEIVEKILKLENIKDSGKDYNLFMLYNNMQMAKSLVYQKDYDSAKNMLFYVIKNAFYNKETDILGCNAIIEALKIFEKQKDSEAARKQYEILIQKLNELSTKYPNEIDRFDEIIKDADMILLGFEDIRTEEIVKRIKEKATNETLKILQEGKFDEKIKSISYLISIMKKTEDRENTIKLLEKKYSLYENNHKKDYENMVLTLWELADVEQKEGNLENAILNFKNASDIIMFNLTIDKEQLLEIAFSINQTLGDILFEKQRYTEYYENQTFEYYYLCKYLKIYPNDRNVKRKIMAIISKSFLAFTQNVRKNYEKAQEISELALDISVSIFNENDKLFVPGMLELIATYKENEKMLGNIDRFYKKINSLIEYLKNNYGEKAQEAINALSEIKKDE